MNLKWSKTAFGYKENNWDNWTFECTILIIINYMILININELVTTLQSTEMIRYKNKASKLLQFLLNSMN